MLQITVTVCANEKKVMEEARRLELEGVVIHEQTPTLTLNVPDRRNEETVDCDSCETCAQGICH